MHGLGSARGRSRPANAAGDSACRLCRVVLGAGHIVSTGGMENTKLERTGSLRNADCLVSSWQHCLVVAARCAARLCLGAVGTCPEPGMPLVCLERGPCSDACIF